VAVQKLAIEHGWYRLVWQLAWAMDNFYHRHGQVRDHVAAWRRGLAAARRAADVDGQILAYRRLGVVSGRAGDQTWGCSAFGSASS